ncbi:MAG: hypothetical protein CL833_06735, partial [Crocinitomicaceae bacterium]|nr:hypothetical protein [Crocinitomicaceae bacterium]
MAQKHNNGKIFDEHPALDIVAEFTKAYTSGDTTTLKALTTEGFKMYNMMNNDPDYTGGTRRNLLGQSMWLSNNMVNLKIENRPPAYPDAMEFKGGPVYVYTYEMMTGFDKNNGFKINSPRNSTFIFDESGKKINRLLFSDNTAHFQKYFDSRETKTNGTIYKDHPVIAKVRLLFAHLETGDLDKAFEGYNEGARIYDINDPDQSFISLAAHKEKLAAFMDMYEIVYIQESGYPDVLDYEGDGKVIISWWDFMLRHKKTG